MANKYRGEVALHAGDAEYTLRFGTNELIEIEDTLGIEFKEDMSDQKWGLKNVRAMVRIGLKKHHSDLDDEKVGDLIDEVGFLEIGEAIKKSFEAVIGSKKASSEPATTGGEPSSSPPAAQV